MSDAFLIRVTTAKNDMMAAEGELEKALGEIRVAPRAEKTTISAIVEAAFENLKSARAKLVELEELLRKEP
ncbi:MAG: hypothetical protein M3O36_19605 [Myxococcota bacterium]|nr:hypothetical protein [Myxococcota bacterium]